MPRRVHSSLAVVQATLPLRARLLLPRPRPLPPLLPLLPLPQPPPPPLNRRRPLRRSSQSALPRPALPRPRLLPLPLPTSALARRSAWSAASPLRRRPAPRTAAATAASALRPTPTSSARTECTPSRSRSPFLVSRFLSRCLSACTCYVYCSPVLLHAGRRLSTSVCTPALEERGAKASPSRPFCLLTIAIVRVPSSHSSERRTSASSKRLSSTWQSTGATR